MNHAVNQKQSGCGCTGCFVVVLGVLIGLALVPIAPFVMAYLVLKDYNPEWDYEDDDSSDDQPPKPTCIP